MITLDTFTRTPGTSVTAAPGETGAAWAVNPAFPGSDAVITPGGAVRNNISGVSEFYASGIPINANYSVEAVVRRLSDPGSATAAICARMDPTAHNAYFLYNFSGTWVLQDGVGNIGTYSAPQADGDRRRIACNGTTIQAWINNILRISGTNSSITAAGRVGLFFNGAATDSTGVHFDSICARAISEINVGVWDGDSQMGSTNTAPLLALAHAMQPAIVDTFESFMVAVGGQTLAQRITAYPTDVAPKFRAAADRNVVALYCGTNDVYFEALNGTPAEDIAGIVISRLQAYAALANATGWDTVVGTITPRAYDGSGGGSADPYDLNPIIDEINTWLRANWRDHFDRLADLAADARLADYTNLTYYNTDRIHWNATGAAVAGLLFAAEINDLTATPSIDAVTSPPGATIALAGEVLPIEWDFTGDVPNVDILGSTDGGITYPIPIANGIPNTGSHNWTPGPDATTATAMIKVRNSTDATDFAESAVFKIATTSAGGFPIIGPGMIRGTCT